MTQPWPHATSVKNLVKSEQLCFETHSQTSMLIAIPVAKQSIKEASNQAISLVKSLHMDKIPQLAAENIITKRHSTWISIRIVIQLSSKALSEILNIVLSYCATLSSIVTLTKCAFSALTPLTGQQEGHPACRKLCGWGAGMVICLGRGADLHMAQLMPLPLTVSYSSKSRLVLSFWYWLTWVVPLNGATMAL